MLFSFGYEVTASEKVFKCAYSTPIDFQYTLFCCLWSHILKRPTLTPWCGHHTMVSDNIFFFSILILEHWLMCSSPIVYTKWAVCLYRLKLFELDVAFYMTVE